MATPTYDLIDSEVLSASAASVTFTSIPATYRDLIIIAEFVNTSTGRFRLQFNGDSGTNYAQVMMAGDGSTSSASAIGTGTLGYITTNYTESRSGATLTAIAQVMDYSATDKHKSVLIRANQPTSTGGGNSDGTEALACRWADTAAITSATISTANSFASGSSFYLYGIAG